MAIARGIRNNNPLNIRRSDQKWFGQRDFQTDREFVEFKTMQYGFRAAFICLRTYINKYHIDSVGRIIHRWAPSTENNTDAYVKQVCRLTKFEPSHPISFENRHDICSLVLAMAIVETGHIFRPSEIYTAYDKLVANNNTF